MRLFVLISIFLVNVCLAGVGQKNAPKINFLFIDTYIDTVNKQTEVASKAKYKTQSKKFKKELKALAKKYPYQDFFKLKKESGSFLLQLQGQTLMSFNYDDVAKGRIWIGNYPFYFKKGDTPNSVAKRIKEILTQKQVQLKNIRPKKQTFLHKLKLTIPSAQAFIASLKKMTGIGLNPEYLSSILVVGSSGYVSAVYEEVENYYNGEENFTDILLTNLSQSMETSATYCRNQSRKFFSSGEDRMDVSSLETFKSYLGENEEIDHRKIITSLLAKYTKISTDPTKDGEDGSKSFIPSWVGKSSEQLLLQRQQADAQEQNRLSQENQQKIREQNEFLEQTFSCEFFMDTLIPSKLRFGNTEIKSKKSQICSVFNDLGQCMEQLISVSDENRNSVNGFFIEQDRGQLQDYKEIQDSFISGEQ